MRRPFTFSIIGIALCVMLVRANAAQDDPAACLQASGYTLDRSDLVRGLHDARPGIRAQAAGMLGEKKYTDALPALEKAISDEKNEKVLFAMLTSAQELGAPDAEKRLSTFCSSHDEALQFMAASYLQSLGDNACIQDMIRFTASPSVGVREGALLYLTHITKLPSPAPTSLGPALLKVVQTDPDEHNVALAAQVIEQIGDPRTKAEYETRKKP